VAHFIIVYFLSSNPWLACLPVSASDYDCISGNGKMGNKTKCFKSGLVPIYNSGLDSFCATVKGVQVLYVTL